LTNKRFKRLFQTTVLNDCFIPELNRYAAFCLADAGTAAVYLYRLKGILIIFSPVIYAGVINIVKPTFLFPPPSANCFWLKIGQRLLAVRKSVWCLRIQCLYRGEIVEGFSAHSSGVRP
jgi:hypothetical protein